MEQKISVKGNVIKYRRETLVQKIDQILNSRFESFSDLNKDMKSLHDPYLLIDMDKAVKRIKKAHKNKEKIIIFGDYDVDGVTSTAILMHFFKKVGFNASYRLPHRVNDGYGLKEYFIDELKDLGVSLIITVDCGSRDDVVITYAKNLGIDIIVTDHHKVPEELPKDAVALINPQRDDCNYIYKGLAGVGVAFKLMSALAKEFLNEKEYDLYLKESIDLAAIGTVADCMELTGENRVIVREGLKQIKNTRSKGLKYLIDDKINEDLDADLFSFNIGPKLNAAGRMDTPYKAINLILNNGMSLVKTIKEIEDLNEKRKYLTKEFMVDAMAKINHKDNLLFYISSEIEHGIIGVLSSRITEQFYKPSIVIKDEGDKLVASCRSPEYLCLMDVLDKYKNMFSVFGGHDSAAGFTIKKENFSDFKTKILMDCNGMNFSSYKREIKVDKLVKLDELGFNFLNKINIYKPYGIGNPKPLFMIENLDYNKLDFLGKSRDHLRFITKYGFKIFGFYMGDYYEQIKRGNKVHLIFDISLDSWMGKKNLLLKIVDLIVE